ncbi:conserved hypothetical protein [Pyrobaculum islandicum DSM 4184]|uniref:Uncharacterized protein n=1 Tax=Pyrobaculum islandicum (strain DSM 4184 / JCM 9189 / GEO3) TaxID=384616 RepID=A1RTP7_PYRIL|nr:hypothetical protein [Pyrobaculum islandicum]ABL88329.1 conserved hypothetical protein [Pyrobaculum islandicum DSM 4184]
MRWVVELVFASFLLVLVLALYNYTAPSSIVVQAGERGRFAELSLFAVRLASSQEFLFRLWRDWDGAVEQANVEAKSVDPLASVDVALPSGGACPAASAPRFSISLATVLPNGTTVCIVVKS